MAWRTRRPGLHHRASSPRKTLGLRLAALGVAAGAAAGGAAVAGAFSGGTQALRGHHRTSTRPGSTLPGSTRPASRPAGVPRPLATAATATSASAPATTSPRTPTTSTPATSPTGAPASTPTTAAPVASARATAALPVTTTLPSPPSPSSVLVEVLNGSGVAREATKAAAALRRAGFLINGTGNASSFLYKDTLVLYPPGAREAAGVLAARILGPTDLQASSKVPAGVVDLVVGDSFQGVAPS